MRSGGKEILKILLFVLYKNIIGKRNQVSYTILVTGARVQAFDTSMRRQTRFRGNGESLRIARIEPVHNSAGLLHIKAGRSFCIVCLLIQLRLCRIPSGFTHIKEL